MSPTHEFNNQAFQAERREVLRNDTMFARQQNTVDDAGGRFAKLTPATITGATPVSSYPQLPPSSPWANGFDTNVEPPLGYAVDEMPAQEPLALSPATEVPSPPPVVGDRANEGPVVDGASFPASSAAGSSIKRRGF